MITITGTTSVIGADSHAGLVHAVQMGEDTYPARFLAGRDVPASLAPAARAAVLDCLECGRTFSAIDLYRDTPTPGECFACASEFLATAHGHAGELCCA